MTTTTTALTGNGPIATAAGRAHQIVDDVVDKAAPAAQAAATKAHAAIDRVAGAGNNAAEWASSNGAQIADKSGALAEACTGYVRARPLVSVTGALALGYLVGRIMR
jgi:ElaB/YqjD/DUF883 family membrane-anchored ribosome-binding protein